MRAMGNAKGRVKSLRIGKSAAKHPEWHRSMDEGSETREMKSQIIIFSTSALYPIILGNEIVRYSIEIWSDKDKEPYHNNCQ